MYKHRDAEFCSLKCSTGGKFNGAYGKKAINDPAVAEKGQKVSKALTERMLRGELITPKNKHKSGHHDSPKAGRVWYRSSYEQKLYQILDADSNVVSYVVEPCVIKFMFNDSVKRYVPDALVTYNLGVQKLIEVKPIGLINDPVNVAKRDAAIIACANAGIIYECWTQKELGI